MSIEDTLKDLYIHQKYTSHQNPYFFSSVAVQRGWIKCGRHISVEYIQLDNWLGISLSLKGVLNSSSWQLGLGHNSLFLFIFCCCYSSSHISHTTTSSVSAFSMHTQTHKHTVPLTSVYAVVSLSMCFSTVSNPFSVCRTHCLQRGTSWERQVAMNYKSQTI